MFILFIFCECLLVVHLLASLVNSIHRNLLCQVAKLLSVVQHTVSVVGRLVVGRLVVAIVSGLVVAIVVGLVVTIVGGLVVSGLVVAIVVGLVVVLVLVVTLVVGLVVALVRVVVGRLVVALVRIVTPGSHAILITGIFEGVVQRRRSVEIIISLVGVCLIIHLV